MSQITSSGRSLIYNRKSVGPRMEARGTLPLTCEDLVKHILVKTSHPEQLEAFYF